MTTSRSLVLGGGGVTGIGWETGLIAGLADRGIRLSEADRIIGTSAGSSVAATLTSGIQANDAYHAQIADRGSERAARLGISNLARFLGPQLLPASDQTIARRIGSAALRAKTVSEAERREIIARRVPCADWPDTDLRITAINASTGERRVFSKDSLLATGGVSLVDAVAASCAVPTVWPPVTIGTHRYIDGGSLSATNADLAAGCDVVVVLAPIAVSLRKRWSVAGQLAALGPGVRTLLITPNDAAKRAMGRNSLDPAFRAAAARAGKDQAAAVADAVGRLWS
ncbi:patatin-like phospholipase family protein [Paeniglutamicibacter antarcticus]|uniref:Patatin-like phospholipase family protein n=1 Tax=Arthrobacter terrae TaxID=2935737 RepID=A0A931G682_9MICC|nr:patatin-like phospholipase family protein [Arthrobacter terrae]MBG0740758.1 patatin-like phospholipase family protein [Arthrobacter terrae]